MYSVIVGVRPEKLHLFHISVFTLQSWIIPITSSTERSAIAIIRPNRGRGWSDRRKSEDNHKFPAISQISSSPFCPCKSPYILYSPSFNRFVQSMLSLYPVSSRVSTWQARLREFLDLVEHQVRFWSLHTSLSLSARFFARDSTCLTELRANETGCHDCRR